MTMKFRLLLLTLSLISAVLSVSIRAQAEELSGVFSADPITGSLMAQAAPSPSPATDMISPVPPVAQASVEGQAPEGQAPEGQAPEGQAPAIADRQIDGAIASNAADLLPPAPPPAAAAPLPSPNVATSEHPVSLSPPSSPPAALSSPAAPYPPAPPASPADVARLFNRGSESLVARTVGHAEGTRTAEGDKTRAYGGHPDPGNGVWNLGSFSFQHCREVAYQCATPEEADSHQLQRLQGQAEQLRQRAAAVGLQLSLEEELNGIDLANQAPAAALGQPGYVEWLQEAQNRGMRGEEAILWARVSAFWDPRIKGWNAPGLGNTEAKIEHDQSRRMGAIARSLTTYQAQVAQGIAMPIALTIHAENIADRLIAFNL